MKECHDNSGPVHPIRLLISEKELAYNVTVHKKGVGFVTQRRVTKGPIAAISTTTQDRVQVDDETRQISIWIDESEEQTKTIVEAALEEKADFPADERKVWHEAQRLIEKRAALPIEFAEWFKRIAPLVRTDNLWARRYFKAFLQACKTVALSRSFQRNGRELQQQGKIVVRFSDFATTLIFNPVLSQSLDRADEEDMEVREQIARLATNFDGDGVRAVELARDQRISQDRAYARLRKATRAGVIVRANEPSKSNVKRYLPTEFRPFIPEPVDVLSIVAGTPTGGNIVLAARNDSRSIKARCPRFRRPIGSELSRCRPTVGRRETEFIISTHAGIRGPGKYLMKLPAKFKAWRTVPHLNASTEWVKRIGFSRRATAHTALSKKSGCAVGTSHVK